MHDPPARVILGLDPGTASTGYGVVSVSGHSFRAVEFGVVTTSPAQPLARRLETLFAQLTDVLRSHNPEATAVESLFFNTNVTTALAVGHARGVALLACAQADCAVFEYTPQQVKMAVVGYGKASKEQMMEMVRVLLRLREIPKPDHAADALGVAICHANSSVIRAKLDGIQTGETSRGRAG